MAFRSFFIGGCLFSIIAITLWWASLQGYVSISIYGNWLWWHAHEMIFGFACAIVVGFLLTAVQTWTGVEGVRGKPLAVLFSLWCSARLVFFLPVPVIVVTTVDASFLFVSALILARPLIKVKMFRNAVFVLLLLMLMMLNIASHHALQSNANPMPFFHGTIMIIVLMISVMGGRVIPLFTSNALKLSSKPALKTVEYIALISTLVLVLFAVLGFSTVPLLLVNLVAGIGTLAHSYRLYRWFDKGILNKPILWSLHLAYAFIPLGLLLMTLQGFVGAVSTSLVIHSFTVGAIGGLILAMISRVSLGHTGRPLVLPKLMPIAFSVLFIGALMRVLLPLINMQFYQFAINGSVLCWVLAFSLFVFSYLPFLLSIRADGKPS